MWSPDSPVGEGVRIRLNVGSLEAKTKIFTAMSEIITSGETLLRRVQKEALWQGL